MGIAKSSKISSKDEKMHLLKLDKCRENLSVLLLRTCDEKLKVKCLALWFFNFVLEYVFIACSWA
jgi:hypothetical protein